jgi:hypothetical protein
VSGSVPAKRSNQGQGDDEARNTPRSAFIQEGDAMTTRSFGETVDGLSVAGQPVTAGMFDEHEVRAAAGLTLVFGAVAFVYAYFAKEYVPIKLVTALFFVEFLLRVTVGLRFSPFGQLARLLTWGQPRHWVSAKPKRFAWSLGLVMSLAMTAITNANIRGTLPLTICLICMTLMWLEAVLGLCLGCEIYAAMVRRGWIARDEAFEICSSGACAVEPQPPSARRP